MTAQVKNGHSNGHATHTPAAPTVNAVERQAVHLQAQERLRAEAARMCDRTLAARALADEAHRTDLEAISKARSACGPQATDAQLDFLARAEVRETLSRAMLAEAIREHERWAATLATGERAVAEAQRTHERIAIEADAPARRATIEGRGAAVLARFLEALEELRSLVADLEADAHATQKARQLGSTLEVIDGLPAARGFLRAMLDRGIDLGNGAEVHPVRWAFDLRPVGRAVPDVGQTATAIATIVIATAMRASTSNGRVAISQALAAWGDARSYAEAARAAVPPSPAAAPHSPAPRTPPGGPRRVGDEDASFFEWEEHEA